MSEGDASTTNSSAFQNGNSYWERKAMATGEIVLLSSYFVVTLVGLVGNSFVIHAVRTNRSMHTSTNYLISNIAVADLTTMATCLPFAILKFLNHPGGKWGRFLCTFITKNNISCITLSVSIMTLCILAVERYNALINPLHHEMRMTKRATLYAIVLTWILALAMAMPLLIFTDFNEKYHYCQFTFTTHLYWIAVGVATFLILVVICYCYIKILREIYNKRLLNAGHCAPQWLNNETTKNKRKVTKLLLSLTVAFVLFFVPRMVYLFFSPYMEKTINLGAFRKISFFLVVCNSCVNPIICGFQSDNYRRAFLAMLRRSRGVSPISRDAISNRDWWNTSQRQQHQQSQM
ncbi:somatostatin receptor type 5-like [Exaiptasia diaphana]|uniref:G-protein coupled receptors family 1 profile domain-containing protein n=1 Tax=Exaiptasia diaphana TaxID=2652724 RepID=A0A913X328_EXADI|nr:somatostatin receptor type 5-like [Exaiptasia diaphana]